jgi:hypothetical protein
MREMNIGQTVRKFAPVLEGRKAVNRFPVPVACAVLFFFVAIFIPDNKTQTDLLQFLFCGCFIFIAATLFAESRNNTGHISAHIAAAIASLFCGVVFHDYKDSVIPFGLLGGASFAGIYLAPFVRRDTTAEQFWAFGYRICLGVTFAFAISAVLFFGLAAIFATIDALFGPALIKIPTLWVFCASIIAPLIAMSMIPRDFDAKSADYTKLGRVILVYVLIPLLALYTLLLYFYMAKIVLFGVLPNGGVAAMVMGYGVCGSAAWLMSIPWRETEQGPRLFSRYFYKLLILPLVLLAVAIFTRIHDYGVTDQRYLVVTCLVWLVGVTAFMLTQKQRPAPQFMYGSLIALLVLSSFGPWGAVSVSINSQTERLHTLLAQTGLLVNGKLVDAVPKPAQEIAEAIRSTAQYLERRDQRAILETAFAPYKQDSETLTEAQQFVEKILPWGYQQHDEGTRFSTPDQRDNAVIATQGFAYILPFDNYSSHRFSEKLPDTFGENCTLGFKTQRTTLILSCGIAEKVEDREELASYDLKPLIDGLAKQGADSKAQQLIRPSSGKAPHDLTLYVRSISGNTSANGVHNINQLHGHLLWRD